MRTFKSIVAVLGVVGLAACNASHTPTAPSSSATSGVVAGSFGTLAQSVGDATATSNFGNCLGGVPTAWCFNASSMETPRLRFPDVESTGTLAAKVAGAAEAAPDPPTNLGFSVSAFSNSSNVLLFWRAPAAGPTPTTYLVEAGASSGTSDVAAFVTGTAFTSYLTTVSGSGTFYVRVKAVGAGGFSTPSNEVVVTVLDPRLPRAPSGLAVSAIGSSVTLTWAPPFSGAPPTSYVIQASSTAGGPADLANFATGNTATTFTATGVVPGTYFVRVLAANSAGIGPASAEASLIVLAPTACVTPPPVPANLVAFVNGSTVVLGWSPSLGQVSSYIVEAGSAPGLVNLAQADTRATVGAATFLGVWPGTYYVRIRAANACGTGGPSNEVVVVVR